MFDHVVAIDRLSGLPYILGENKEQRDIESCKCKKYKCSHLMDARTCSSWLNCALRDIEAMFWVSVRPYEACVTDA